MRYKMLSPALLFVMIASECIPAAASYDRPRKAKLTIYNQPPGNGPAHWQWGKQLFWENADTSGFWDYRKRADEMALSGVAPVMNTVGWERAVQWGDTTRDTLIAFKWRDPAWVAYSNWTYARDSLTSVGPSGNYVQAFDDPNNSYWIPFTIPLDSVDCPKGMKRCTYGDFAADRIGRLAARTNLAGLYAADFVDGLPGGNVTEYSFHPRILKAFEDSTGIKLPEGSVSVKSKAILSLHRSAWIDYWADAWGKFYSDVAKHVRNAGRVEPLICAQSAWDIPRRRAMGVDFRRYLNYMPGKNWFFAVEMQGDNLRPMKPHGQQVGLFGTYTSWEPSMTMGAKINVKDAFIYDALRNARIPATDSNAVQFLRSQYLLVGFTHIANRSGSVRRATQAFEYGYADNQGAVDPRITKFLLTHFPRRPYGPGFYYSESQVKSLERDGKPMNIIRNVDSLWNIAPLGYFATDAALDSLRPESRPTAWIVPHADRLPQSERAKLQAFAPILSADSAAKRSPIQATGRGKAWGFWDHESSLVVLISNPDSVPLNTTLTVAGLQVGGWQVAYLGLQDSAKKTTLSSGATYSLQMNVAPYDTRAYVFQRSSTVEARRAIAAARSLPKKRLTGPLSGVEVLDHSGQYRDALGRFRIPY